MNPPASKPPSGSTSEGTETRSTGATPTGAAGDGGRPAALRRFFPWLLAVGLGLTAGRFAILHDESESRIALMRQHAELAEFALQAAHNQLAAERIITTQQLTDPGELGSLGVVILSAQAPLSTAARAVAVWAPRRQAGILHAEGLPAAPENQTYQLWILGPAEKPPVAAGTFTPDAASGRARLVFRFRQAPSEVAGFGVMLGSKGGPVRPDGTFVLLGR